MALHERSARLTYDDYVLFPQDGRRHEVIDGEHYVTAAPFLRHQSLVRRLIAGISPVVDAADLGELFPAPTDVLLSRHDVVQPDLVFVAKERRHILTERNIQGAPDLVVEILSEKTRRVDTGEKYELYERCGVGEYLLVDPVSKTVSVYRLLKGRFHSSAELSAAQGDVLTTPLLPGLQIKLADLFK